MGRFVGVDFNMNNKIIDEIKEKIVKEVKPKTIILFGSMVNDRLNENSDIDVCVIEDKAADKTKQYVKIRKALMGIVWPMDILLMDSGEFGRRKDIWGTVQYEIDKKGIILYERRN